MHVVESLDIPQLEGPIALTIGNFDGVHPGHQYLLKHLKSLGTPVVLTFSNHPREFLTGKKVPLLTTIHKRLRLLKEHGVALTIMLPFTEELANKTYREFLTGLYEKVSFDHLLLGEGASLGKNREGTPKRIVALGCSLGFKSHFLKKLPNLSSSRLRNKAAGSSSD